MVFLLWPWVVCDSAWSFQITAPSPQQIKPGQWLSVPFSITGDRLACDLPGILPVLSAPNDWPVLVAPERVCKDPSTTDQHQSILVVLEVPMETQAGRYSVGLAVGGQQAEASIEVLAEQRWQWLEGDGLGALQRRHSWWWHTPWVHQWALALQGNAGASVVIDVTAPKGLEVRWSPDRASIEPNQPLVVEVKVRARPDTQWWPGQRVGLTLQALNGQGQVLKAERVTLTLEGQRQVEPQGVWHLSAFGQTAMQADRRQSGTRWGLRGRGHADLERTQAIDFVWMSEPHLGRWLGHQGPHHRWRIGRQVFADPLAFYPATQGQGMQWHWQSHAQDAHQGLRLGLWGFSEGQHRHWRPTIGWGPWQWSVWSMQNKDPGQGPSSRNAWVGSYQSAPQHNPSLELIASHHRRRWAGSLRLRWVGAQRTWSAQGQWVPEGHFSTRPATGTFGFGWTEQLPQDWRFMGQVRWTRQPDTLNDDPTRYQRTGQWRFDRPLAWPEAGRVEWGVMETPHSSLQSDWRAFIGWSGRHGHFRWRTRIESAGDWLARLSWVPGTHWQGHLDYRHRSAWGSRRDRFGVSLGGRIQNQWQWSLAWLHQSAMPGITEIEEVIGLSTASGQQAHAHLSHRWGDGHRLSLSLEKRWEDGASRQGDDIDGHDIQDHDIQGWLKYQWQGRVSMPVQAGTQTGQLQGRVVAVTAQGKTGISGVVVKIDGQSARTNASGHYRFQAVTAGRHRLRLDPSTLRRGWLAWNGLQHAVAISAHQQHVFDWSVVQAGGVRGTFHWPVLSDHTPRFDNVVVSFVCVSCLRDVRSKHVVVDATGGFVVEGLLPGRWRSEVVQGSLPRAHHWPGPVEIEVEAGQVHRLSWPMDYRPEPIQWQQTQRIGP